MTGREFAAYILPRYNVRLEAAQLILDNCEFELDDEFSTRGGGWCRFGYNGEPTVVHFNTAQHEAALHELAHAWWFLQGGRLIDKLLRAFLHEADQPHGEYSRARDLCRVYKDGDGQAFAGMWVPAWDNWNHDEIFAGLASGTMGDMALMPPSLRSIYREMFLVLDPMAYLPRVTA